MHQTPYISPALVCTVPAPYHSQAITPSSSRTHPPPPPYPTSNPHTDTPPLHPHLPTLPTTKPVSRPLHFTSTPLSSQTPAPPSPPCPLTPLTSHLTLISHASHAPPPPRSTYRHPFPVLTDHLYPLPRPAPQKHLLHPLSISLPSRPLITVVSQLPTHDGLLPLSSLLRTARPYARTHPALLA